MPAPYTLATGAAAKSEDVPRLAPLMGEALIFPSAKRTTPLSDMALSAVIRRMNAARPEGAPAPLARRRLAEGNGAGRPAHLLRRSAVRPEPAEPGGR